MIYAGIGSRRTPPDVCAEMESIAAYAASWLHVLRTGAAVGADQSFMRGCKRASGRAEIYLPNPKYEEPSWDEYPGFDIYCRPTVEAVAIAKHFHPAWGKCSSMAKLLHGRNTHIVMGPMCQDPVDLLVCYTPGGSEAGGTGQALRLAKASCIRVIDLGAPEPWNRTLDKVYSAFEMPARTLVAV